MTTIPPSPLRILFIDHTAAMGGGEIALLHLLTHLDRTKVSPIVLLFADGPLRAKLENLDVHVLPLDPQISGTRKESLGSGSLRQFSLLLRLIPFILRVARFIRLQNVDLVHTNSLKSDLIGGIAARLARRRVIWHVRDRISEDYLPPIAARAFRLLARIIPTFVVANSKATLRTIYSGTPPSNAAVVLDALDVQGLDVRVPNSITRFGIVGRISPWKGQHVFIRAAAEVHQRHPEVRFVVIGAPLFGEEEYDAEIRQLANTLFQGEDVVEFTGFCPDVPRRIAALDVVVHASTSGEPFGQVIIEGMAAGKPVIATDGGGVPEIVQHGVTGRLVKMGDVHEMSEAMLWMISHSREAAQMGAKGRARVEDQFTIGRLVKQIQEIFARVKA